MTPLLLDALAPGGALRAAVDWRDADPGLRDVQLRREPKGRASWASLYLGLTSVLDVYEQGGRVRLDAHRTHREAAGFADGWSAWRPLEELREQWGEVAAYLQRVEPLVHARWTRTEGRTHALIAARLAAGTVIQREASLSFLDQPTKDRLVDEWRGALLDALAAAGRSEPWWRAVEAVSRGTSPDFLAVDDQGRLLVIEAKPASAAAGIVASPAQVSLYAAMYAEWLREVGSDAVAVLRAELEQRRALGLANEDTPSKIADMPAVVPVVAVGPGLVSPEVWTRLAAVHSAVGGVFDGVEPVLVWRLRQDGTARSIDVPAAAVEAPPDLDEDVQASSYEDRARASAVRWKQTLPAEARPDGPYGSSDNLYPFCLPVAAARLNLLPEAQGAVEFFSRRRIQWHNGVGGGPTNHLVSSQVQCVNALFPMTTDAVRLRRAFAGVLKVAEVFELDGALLTFEFNGGGPDYLGEGRGSGPLPRGAHSTSTDAAFAYRTADGCRELALVEWKYTEQYRGSRLSQDPAGRREKRYREFYRSEQGPLDHTVLAFEDVLVEPLYQLVRQQLLAWRIEQSGEYERVRVVHVVPAANVEYERSLDPRAFGGRSVSEQWERMLRPEFADRYHRLDAAVFLDPELDVTSAAYRARYGHG